MTCALLAVARLRPGRPGQTLQRPSSVSSRLAFLQWFAARASRTIDVARIGPCSQAQQPACVPVWHQTLVDQSQSASVVDVPLPQQQFVQSLSSSENVLAKSVLFCAKTAVRSCHAETCPTRCFCRPSGPVSGLGTYLPHQTLQKRIDELLLHCIDEGRPPRLCSCGCLDTPPHRVPIQVTLPVPAATSPLPWPRLRPAPASWVVSAAWKQQL